MSGLYARHRHRLPPCLVSAAAVVLASPTSAQKAQPLSIRDHAAYEVRYGPLHAGTATLSVLGVDTVRGRDAYHVRLTLTGGVNLLVYKYTLRDTLESWVDSTTLNSLRFTQRQWHRGKLRNKDYEIFPDRRTFADGGKPEQPSVANPLDDLALLYLVRMLPLDAGTSTEIPRYFKPASNPVVVKVIGRDTIEAAGRKWNTIVVQPIIKTSTMFADGEGRVWLSDDGARQIVQLSVRASIGSITMRLLSNRAEPPR